jgi:replication factor A1
MSEDDVEEIQRCIDEILGMLSEGSGKKVTREELEREFQKFLEYGVPIEHAKQTLLKKYGGTVGGIRASSERVLMVDLQPNETNVHLVGRIISVNPKQITVKDEARTIFYGIIGDESGSVQFTAWKDFELVKGDVVEVSNAYTREWQGGVQVNFGDRTVIEKTDETRLTVSDYEPREYKIKDLRAGIGPVDITVRILEIGKREVTVANTAKTVYSGMCGDETGKAQYTSWHDFSLNAGDIVRVAGGYVRSWKGIPQITFDENATVEKLAGDKIPLKVIKTQQISLHELVERHGALDVSVEGTVIEIREGSGVVVRCSECNRVLRNDECTIHGKVKGVSDLRLKVVLDDGTGSISGIIGREQTEQLLGKTFDEWKKLGDQSSDNAVVRDELNQMLFAHRIGLEGNALGDMYGVSVIAKKAWFADFDIKAESEKLKSELEEFT